MTALPLLSFAPVVARDLRNRGRMLMAPEVHLRAAVDWLVRAQDATPDGGVSYGFSLKGGWRPSYVETTGYIVPTLFDVATICGRHDLRARARQMLDWLCTMQRGDGSFTNARFARDSGIVFDTGQVLLGLVRGYRETGGTALLNALERAARWLVEEAADEDGRWTHQTHFGIPHVYNTRVAWALVQAGQHLSGPAWEQVARANLDWALTQEEFGWFENCAFESGVAAYTHTIAYAIRGLWEAGQLLSDTRYQAAARRAASSVARQVDERGFLAGQFDSKGRPAGHYCCLTGNCQMAIVWALLHAVAPDETLYDSARRALRYVMAAQDLTTPNDAIRGAIKGSQPIWGAYAPFSYPNWAAKFFVDATLLCGS